MVPKTGILEDGSGVHKEEGEVSRQRTEMSELGNFTEQYGDRILGGEEWARRMDGLELESQGD